MTLLDDRPDLDDEPLIGEISTRAVKRSLGSWRLAARLALREMRHRWGRSIIVVLLIVVPVAGMTYVDLDYRERDITTDNRTELGSADARLDFGTNDDFGVVPDMEPIIAPLLGDGTEALWFQSAQVPMRRADGIGGVAFVAVSNLDLREEITVGIGGLSEGRYPIEPDEIVMNQSDADTLEVRIGDRFTLEYPNQSFTLVGVADDHEFPSWMMATAAPGYDFTALRPRVSRQSVIIRGPNWMGSRAVISADTPRATAGLSRGEGGGEAGEYRDIDFSLTRPTVYSAESDADGLVARWAYGTLALAAFGVIIAAAFAVSGRRQLVTVGQLSAQGASQSTIVRFLILQGLAVGVVGGGIGVIAGRALWGRSGSPWTEARSPGLLLGDAVAILLTAIGVATTAAWVPSRSLSRMSVLSSLGGRRPLGVPSRRLVSIGFGLGLAGAAIAALAFFNARSAAGGGGGGQVLGAVVGLAAVVAGLCCLSPVLTEVAARFVARRPGAARLAARSLVRHRVRSAALLASIVAVMATAMVAATAVERNIDRDREMFWGLPTNVLVLQSYADDGDPRGPGSAPPSVDPSIAPELAEPDIRAKVERIVGEVRWVETTRVFGDTDRPMELAGINDRPEIVSAVLGTDEVIDLYGLSAEAAAVLRQRGAIYVEGSFAVRPVAPGESESMLTLTVGGAPVTLDRANSGEAVDGQARIIVTQQLVDDIGLHVAGGPLYAVRDRPYTQSELERVLPARVNIAGQEAHTFLAAPPIERSLEIWTPSLGRGNAERYRVWTSVLVVLLVLLVVAFGLVLWSAEGRDEQRMMAAIGASPKTLSRMTAWRALTLTMTAAFVAVPFGYAAAKAVALTTSSSGRNAPFPWVVAAVILVAVPCLVTAASAIGSATGRRLRPPSYDFSD